jgi:hypothetical protein
LAQDYPRLEVIAVDDRSTDATGAILDALAIADSRLRVVHVRELPEGWLGKLHAMHLAAESTTAPWLLFTDADVIFEPGALRRSLAHALAERADHVAVIPDFVAEGLGERLFLAMFYLMLVPDAMDGRVENPRRRSGIGIGAFNLVRAEMLRAIGGFRRLALSVDDDMWLGRALKIGGGRSRVLMGVGAVSVRWQVGLWGLIRGLEKNMFAVLEYRPIAGFLFCLAIPLMTALPFLGLFVGPWWTRAVCGVGLLAFAGVVELTRRQTRIGWPFALTMPISAVLLSVATARSIALTLWRGGVRWRDHLYPLDQLRAHVRERNAWAREAWQSTRQFAEGREFAVSPQPPK